MSKRIRPAGEILCKIEKLMDELIDDHKFQCGDILYNQYGWIKIHRPDAIEEYEDGGEPTFYYGPKEEE